MKYNKRQNPVALAMAKANLVEVARMTKIQVYLTSDGEDCTDLLSKLSVLIGTACEAGGQVEDRVPWVRQLHGSLRQIIDLCVAGYKWNTELAHAFNRAIELAESKVLTLPVAYLYDALLSAQWVANRITEKKIDGTEIAT